MIPTELQKQLEARAAEELNLLYRTKIKAFYDDFKRTFHHTRGRFEDVASEVIR